MHGLVHKAHRAAGTKPQFWNKWGNVGGSTSWKSKTSISAAINEFNDETNVSFTTKSVRLDGHQKSPDGSNALILRGFKDLGNLHLYVFEIPDFRLFSSIFPEGGRYDGNLMNSSHGEIDQTGSFSRYDISVRNDTLSYFMTTLVHHVDPIIGRYYTSYANKWNTATATRHTWNTNPTNQTRSNSWVDWKTGIMWYEVVDGMWKSADGRYWLKGASW